MKLWRETLIVSMVCLAFVWPVKAASVVLFGVVQKSVEEVQVSVRNAEDLSAFEIEFQFEGVTDAKGATYYLKNILPTRLLENSSRSFTLAGPQIGSDGRVTFGFYSLGTSPGLCGEGNLARILYESGASPLRIINVKATDSKGKVLPCSF